MRNLLVFGSQGTLGNYLSSVLSLEFKIVKFTARICLEDQKIDQVMHLIRRHKIDAIINAICRSQTFKKPMYRLEGLFRTIFRTIWFLIPR